MTHKGPLVVGFNGPPKVGKDTIATELGRLLDQVTDMPIQTHALAAPMRQAAFELLGIQGGDKLYNEIKDKPLELINGGTLRQFMIDISERFVKPVYGTDFWARRLYAANKFWWDKIPTILIITDIGFPAEVEFLCETSTSYLNVRVDRPGPYDFSIDSRNYVASQMFGGQDFALTNDSTPQVAAEEILKLIGGRLRWPVL